MRRDLTPGAAERLLEIGAPLADRPHLTGFDVDRYDLGPEIGRGGMGVVYQAFDRELERRVALKVLSNATGLSDEARARFVREARAAARLVHPHIACVYDATPEAIAMQRIDGETLAERRDLDARALASLIRDAALAIHYAHGEGVVHRDLKPANLMVEERERAHVYVMDFGLAKERAVDSSLSLSGSVLGTPGYMAPEQAGARGGEVGPRTDVYGLGATLFACLAGRPPFEGPDVVSVLRRVVEEEAPALGGIVSGVDRDLELIVARCLEKDPVRRYPTALALAGDLDRWLRGEAVEARAPSLVYRFRRYVSRRQGAIVAGGVAAGLALLVAGPLLWQAREKRSTAEAQKVIADRVVLLSQRVDRALGEARAARNSGLGHEVEAFPILEEAITDCRAFLAETEVGSVQFLLGRLLREQGNLDQALSALDQADAAVEDEIPGLAMERGLTLAGLYRLELPLLGEPPHEDLDDWRERGAVDLARALADDSLPATAERIFAEAELAWLSGDVEMAIARHREVLEMDVAHRGAHLALAKLYALSDRPELAMRHSVVATDLLRGKRRAYLAQAGRGGLDDPALESEWLQIEGVSELFVDFNLLLGREPNETHTYGLRGQVQARKARRAQARGDLELAMDHLELALREYDAVLTVRADYPPALVNRGACRVLLSRILAQGGEVVRAGKNLDAAGLDYDRALRADSGLAGAWYDRALLLRQRAQLAQVAGRLEEVGLLRDRAASDADRALARMSPEDPHRRRIVALCEELRSGVDEPGDE